MAVKSTTKKKPFDMEKFATLVMDEFQAVNQKMDTRFEAIDRRFEAIDKRFETIDRRFEAIDRRFDAIDSRFDRIEDELRSMRQELSDIRHRLDVLEARTESNAGFAKEIDHLLQRVRMLEERLDGELAKRGVTA